MVKNPPANARDVRDPGSVSGMEDPLEEEMAPIFLPGGSHGQRCLVGCSPWGHEELDTTEAT